MFVAIPDIADNEVRRELLRADKTTGLRRLDALKSSFRYLPITSDTMFLAARFWAETRRRGQPTADDHALDGDVILAAQATLLQQTGESVIVATTNPQHLSRFVDARLWAEIE